MAKKLITVLTLLCTFLLVSFAQPAKALEHTQGDNPTAKTYKTQEASGKNNTYYTNKFAVLTYHHIDTIESTYTISPWRFMEHLHTLKNLGYNFISIDQAAEFLKGNARIPANAVLVTFDDGYDSFYRYAYPVLKQRSIPATMFLVVRYVGANNNGVQRLDWDQISEMQDDGFSFHSHTYDSHYYVPIDDKGNKSTALGGFIYRRESGKSETLYDFQIRVGDDLAKSREIIETKTGKYAEFLALPFGIANNEAIEIAQDLGFTYIFTTKQGLNSKNTPICNLRRFNAGSPNKIGYSIHQDIMAHLNKTASKPGAKTKPASKKV